MITGIDVSKYQGNIDWPKAKTAGAKFAFIKASQGNFSDPKFVANRTGALASGILWGGYHFLQYDIAGRTQAECFWSVIHDTPLQLPPVADFEWFPAGVVPANAMDILVPFLVRIEELSGRTPIIYTSSGFWQTAWNGVTNWQRYQLWVANYGVVSPHLPYPWAGWTFWQYTNKGNGTLYGAGSLDLDMDYFNGTDGQLRALAEQPISKEVEILMQRVSAMEVKLSKLRITFE